MEIMRQKTDDMMKTIKGLKFRSIKKFVERYLKENEVCMIVFLFSFDFVMS